MLEDLERRTADGPETRVFHTDATAPVASGKWRADVVITSPPYPNRYSYVWNTRPHLYFFDFFSGKTEASALDKQTIGGTWGTATSMLSKGEVPPEFDVVDDVISPLAAEIRQRDALMANYVLKYFNMLTRQIVAMERFVAKDVRVAYVVGNSRIKDVYVETDVLLAKILEGLDLRYRVTNVDRFRRRNSGVDLYESIVFAKK